MKIVDLETFLGLPRGTIFLKYEPCFFEDLRSKRSSIGNDFCSEDITAEILCDDSDEFQKKLFSAHETGDSLLMDFDCGSRDGCFKSDQLFAVYEKSDLTMLIDKLNRCMAEAY